ncbi:MAG: STAS domain-containing protein [Planctomycetes bacterium]|nr:STAS domain-containing protein [Planctomycetota bacterium]
MAELNFQVVHVAKLPKTAHARLEGIIDVTTAERFAKTLRTLIDDMGFIRLILDFEGIDFVNSSGFTQLIDLSDYISEKNGIIVLCNVRDDIINLIQELGISVFYSFTSNVESAKALIMDTLSRNATSQNLRGHRDAAKADSQRAVLTAIPINSDTSIPVQQKPAIKVGNQDINAENNDYNSHSTSPIPINPTSLKGLDFPNITSPLPIEQEQSQYEESEYNHPIQDESQFAVNQLDVKNLDNISVAVSRSSVNQQLDEIPEDFRLWVNIFLTLKTGNTGTLNLLVQIKNGDKNDPDSFVIHSRNTFITLIPVIKGGRCKPAKMAINAGQHDAEFSFRIAPGGSTKSLSESSTSGHGSCVEIWYGNREMKTMPSPNPW